MLYGQMWMGQYAPRHSPVHRLDPRTKLGIVLVFMALCFLVKRWDGLLFLMIPLLLFYRLSDFSVWMAFEGVRPLLWLLFFTFVLHGFLTEGIELFRIPLLGMACSQEGISQGLFYGLRILLLVMLANLLTLTTSPMSLTDGFEKLLKPFERFGVPAHDIGMMMSISMRFIPILFEEMERIRLAQTARGARFEGHFFARLKALVPILIPLFVSAFRKANDLALAMDARCYRGGHHRTSYQVLRFSTGDYVAWALCLGIGIALLWMQSFCPTTGYEAPL